MLSNHSKLMLKIKLENRSNGCKLTKVANTCPMNLAVTLKHVGLKDSSLVGIDLSKMELLKEQTGYLQKGLWHC